MDLGLDKCAKVTLLKEKLKPSNNVDVEISNKIKLLEQHDIYKCLDIDEHDGIQQKNMKKKLIREYFR